MTDTVTATAPAAAAKKTKVAKKPGVAKAKGKAPTHPPTAQMVNAAIKALKERGGSSLQAIKKYISSTYKVDAEKLSPFIRKYIKASVVSGSLVQTKGKGASGSFKLPGDSAGKAGKPKAKKAASKPKAASASPKKSPAKAKKAKKLPTAPKTPKAKKVKAPAKAKKAAPTPKPAAEKPKASPKKAPARKAPKKKASPKKK